MAKMKVIIQQSTAALNGGPILSDSINILMTSYASSYFPNIFNGCLYLIIMSMLKGVLYSLLLYSILLFIIFQVWIRKRHINQYLCFYHMFLNKNVQLLSIPVNILVFCKEDCFVLNNHMERWDYNYLMLFWNSPSFSLVSFTSLKE